MDKLNELIALCKASVAITINDHRDCYESVEQYIEKMEMMNYDDETVIEEIGEEIYNEMVSRDTIVKVQAYPRTPIGFYNSYHYDVDAALDQIIEAVKDEQRRTT